MLREIEFSNAKLAHLTLIGDEVQLTLPLHKTDSYGRLTTRSLRCCCWIRRSTLCPWHAAERHLVRVSLHRSFPTFPHNRGQDSQQIHGGQLLQEGDLRAWGPH